MAYEYNTKLAGLDEYLETPMSGPGCSCSGMGAVTLPGLPALVATTLTVQTPFLPSGTRYTIIVLDENGRGVAQGGKRAGETGPVVLNFKTRSALVDVILRVVGSVPTEPGMSGSVKAVIEHDIRCLARMQIPTGGRQNAIFYSANQFVCTPHFGEVR